MGIGKEIGKEAGHHPPLVQVESNVEEWPVFQLGRSRSDTAKVEHTVKGEDGSELRQRLEVSAPGKYRLPSRFDYDVYSAVLELLEIRGGMPEDGTLAFSLHELMVIMDVKPSGRTYDEVRRSLRRIAATVLESDNAFWSKGQERHISDTFNLWNVRFDSVTDKNGSGSRHEIEFGKLFRRSFEEQYLRGLDIELFWALDSPVAKRLYRLVDLKREGSASWSTDLFDLQKRIPIGPYDYVSKIKEKLAAGHGELVERGFLSSVDFEGKSGVRYLISEAFVRRRKGLELAGTSEEIIAIKLLTESGLRGDVARDLVAAHGPAYCTRYANALPRQRNLQNPPGWLRRAIEEGYDVEEESAVATADEQGDDYGWLFAEPDGGETDNAGDDAYPPSLTDRAAEDEWRSIADELAAVHEGETSEEWLARFTGYQLIGDALVVVGSDERSVEELRRRFGPAAADLWRRRRGTHARLFAETRESAPAAVRMLEQRNYVER